MSDTNDTRSITLKDGRRLGYREIGEIGEIGDPAGTPIIFCHGTPGSRFCLSERDAIVRIPGTRWILPERPGYGISDPMPQRRLRDWADDVEQLADALGLDTFIVAGGSGGGPHALVCARYLGRRTTSCLIFASPSPLAFPRPTAGLAFGNRLGVWLARFAPWLYRLAMDGMQSSIQAKPERFIETMRRQLPAPDAELLADPDFAAEVLLDVVEGYRQGSEAHAIDGRLILASRDWGFSLEDIEIPVYGWYGDQDTLVSRGMTDYLTAQIPSLQMRIVEGAGHLLSDHPDVTRDVQSIVAGNPTAPSAHADSGSRMIAAFAGTV